MSSKVTQQGLEALAKARETAVRSKNTVAVLQSIIPKITVEETEAINHPSHYGGDSQYEVIKVLEAWLSEEEFIGFLKGNIIKYTARAGKKDSSTLQQDHEKSSWYDNYLKEFLVRKHRS